MGQKEKLIARLKAVPRDFTYTEAVSLLGFLSYQESRKGRTSGSRVRFVSPEHPPILLHRPHPHKELKEYQVRQLLDMLQQEGLL